jgi:uncharacterized protein YkwD
MNAPFLLALIATRSPLIAVGLAACVLTTMPAASTAAEVSAQTEPARAAALIVQQTNAFRAAHRLPALRVEARLAEAAQRFAEFMASHDQYGHEADGRPPEARVRDQGYEYCAVAENIGYQFSTAGFTSDELARRLVDGWEQSPGHRRNMLLPNVVDIGVGVARSARTRNHYAVQLFGRPRSASTRFEIANRADVGVRYELEGQAFDLAPRVTRTHEGCFGGDVKLQWPDGSPGPALAPRQGVRYTVVRDNGALRVQSN